MDSYRKWLLFHGGGKSLFSLLKYLNHNKVWRKVACLCVHKGKNEFVLLHLGFSFTPSLPCFVGIDLSFFSEGMKWLSLLLSVSFNSFWHHKRMWWHISSVIGEYERDDDGEKQCLFFLYVKSFGIYFCSILIFPFKLVLDFSIIFSYIRGRTFINLRLTLEITLCILGA